MTDLTIYEHRWAPRTNRFGHSRCDRCGYEFDTADGVPQIPPCWVLKPVDPERADAYHAALQATLLFHSGSPWDDTKRLRWLELTGEREATTRALCDAVRRALG